MIGDSTLPLYHFITFIAFIILPFLSHLSPHYFFDEETLPPPSHYRYGLCRAFSFAPGTAGSFAGYAYLVLGLSYLVSSACLCG